MIHDLEQVHSLPVMRSAVVQILGIFVHPHLCYTPVVLKVQVLKKLLIHLTSKEHCEETNEADFKLYTWKKSYLKITKNYFYWLVQFSFTRSTSHLCAQLRSNHTVISTPCSRVLCTFILTPLVLFI